MVGSHHLVPLSSSHAWDDLGHWSRFAVAWSSIIPSAPHKGVENGQFDSGETMTKLGRWSCLHFHCGLDWLHGLREVLPGVRKARRGRTAGRRNPRLRGSPGVNSGDSGALGPALRSCCTEDIWVDFSLVGTRSQHRRALKHNFQFICGKEASESMIWRSPFEPQNWGRSSRHQAVFRVTSDSVKLAFLFQR